MAPKIIRSRRAMANLQTKIREAINAGRSAQSRGKSEARFLQTLNGKKVTLQDHLGHVTEAGKAYYSALGIPVPKLYNSETPLSNDQGDGPQRAQGPGATSPRRRLLARDKARRGLLRSEP